MANSGNRNNSPNNSNNSQQLGVSFLLTGHINLHTCAACAAQFVGYITRAILKRSSLRSTFFVLAGKNILVL